MFKKLKSLFFVEEEVEITPEENNQPEEKTVSAVEETIVINRLETMETPKEQVEEKAKTFTFKETKPTFEQPKERPQINYEFETILSPITGRSTKQKTSNKTVNVTKVKTVSTEPSAYTTVISPMFGTNKQTEINQVKVDDRLDEEEVTLEQILSNNDNEEEIVQVPLFEGEEQ